MSTASARILYPQTSHRGAEERAPATDVAGPRRLEAVAWQGQATPEVAALRSTPVFAGAAPSVLSMLAQGVTLRHVAPGRPVAAHDGLVIVVRGLVRRARRADNGRELTLESFRAGDVIADGVLGEADAPPDELVASESSVLAFVGRSAVVAHLRQHPEAALILARATQARLERARELAAGVVLSDVPGRVVWALRLLAAREGQADADGVLLRRRPTQQELANSIGACRETVSRIVSDLTRQGLLVVRGRTLMLSRRLLGN